MSVSAYRAEGPPRSVSAKGGYEMSHTLFTIVNKLCDISQAVSWRRIVFASDGSFLLWRDLWQVPDFKLLVPAADRDLPPSRRARQ